MQKDNAIEHYKKDLLNVTVDSVHLIAESLDNNASREEAVILSLRMKLDVVVHCGDATYRVNYDDVIALAVRG